MIKYINRDLHSGEESNSTTPIIAWLLSNLGETSEHWLWEMDWDIVEDLINEKIKQEVGKESIDMSDPSMLAMRKFQIKLKSIRSHNE